MFKRISIAIALTIAPAAIAQAAEVAERQVIGFNSSGSVFVFEQFGVQDGSGFPYSEIYHIQTATGGTAFWPARAIVRDETKPVGKARRLARIQAFQPHGFLDMGVHVFHHALNEASNSPTSATFNSVYGTTVGDVGNSYEVSLTLQPTSVAQCSDFTAGVEKTVEVSLTNMTTGTTSTLRGASFPPGFYNYLCPTDYSIGDVVLFRPTGSTDTKIAVLVSTFVVGFEGPDRKFYAITGTLN